MVHIYYIIQISILQVITNNKLIIIVCDNGGHAVIIDCNYLKVEKNLIVYLKAQKHQI